MTREEEIEARLKAATPGPWDARGHCVYFANSAGGFSLSNCPNPEANAQLCANSPADIRYLLDRNAALRKAGQDLLDQVDSLDDFTLTRDIEPYKAEANWNNVIQRMRDALKGDG